MRTTHPPGDQIRSRHRPQLHQERGPLRIAAGCIRLTAGSSTPQHLEIRSPAAHPPGDPDLSPRPIQCSLQGRRDGISAIEQCTGFGLTGAGKHAQSLIASRRITGSQSTIAHFAAHTVRGRLPRLHPPGNPDMVSSSAGASSPSGPHSPAPTSSDQRPLWAQWQAAIASRFDPAPLRLRNRNARPSPSGGSEPPHQGRPHGQRLQAPPVLHSVRSRHGGWRPHPPGDRYPLSGQ